MKKGKAERQAILKGLDELGIEVHPDDRELFRHYEETGDATPIWREVETYLGNEQYYRNHAHQRDAIKAGIGELPVCFKHFLGQKINAVLEVESGSSYFPRDVVKALGIVGQTADQKKAKDQHKELRDFIFIWRLKGESFEQIKEKAAEKFKKSPERIREIYYENSISIDGNGNASKRSMKDIIDQLISLKNKIDSRNEPILRAEWEREERKGH